MLDYFVFYIFLIFLYCKYIGMNFYLQKGNESLKVTKFDFILRGQ